MHNEESRQISREHYSALCTYIENNLVEECFSCAMPQAMPPAHERKARSASKAEETAPLPFRQTILGEGSVPCESAPPSAPDMMEKSARSRAVRQSEPVAFLQAVEEDKSGEASLEEYLRSVRDESFSEMLLRKIDEKDIRDADCYKKANIDKRLFSKIRSNPSYKPSKQTALALILALELPYAEAVEMLHKAGYALSHASKADLIVEYYLQQGIYDIFVINNSLYDFDQPLIGCK